MTNKEMIANYNFMYAMREREMDVLKERGEQLFGGRIKLTYAILKNMGEFIAKLKAYNEAKEQLEKEYPSLFGDEASKDAPKDDIAQEYGKKLEELLEIDVEDVTVKKVNLDVFEGLSFSSPEIEMFDFMIEE